MSASEDHVSVVSERFRRRLFPLLILGLAFFAFLLHLAMTTSVAAPRAQETATPPPAEATPSPGPQFVPEPEPGEWAPVNLSRSGAAYNASTVVDASGVVHVVWQEEDVDTFYYAQGQDDQWSYPAQLEFPYGTRAYTPELAEDDDTPLYQPQFVAAGERVFAFWIDNEGVAYSSSVPHSDFTTFAAWSTPQAIAGNVLKLSAAVGEEGVFHVGYVRNAETEASPAGIYYVSSDSSGADWAEPVLLYGSRYFRTLPAEEAHVQTAAEGTGRVFVVWDNRPIDKVFVARSQVGGQSWDEPEVVDFHRPADDLEAAGPSQIQVSATGDGVHLVWTAAHATPRCTVYHQWSADGGSTWMEPQRVFAETSICPARPRLVWGLDGVLFLLAGVNTEARLAAWRDGEWSDPQLQPVLSSFLNPANNRRIEFQWQDIWRLSDEELLVVGRSRGGVSATSGDIWLLMHNVSDVVEGLFPPPSPWVAPTPIATGNEVMRELDAAAGLDELVHVVWTQVRESEGDEAQNDTLMYARWNGAVWTQPARILTMSDEKIRQLDLVAGASGKLFLTWAGSPGSIYFSRVNGDRAHVPADWSTPLLLTEEYPAAGSPVLFVTDDGGLEIVYAVTLNEGRGIYVTSSSDEGATWSAPQQIFDAASEAWAMIDGPAIFESRDDDVRHALWVHYSLPPDAKSLGLYYIRSTDGGVSWTGPEKVAAGNVLWHAIGAAEGELHRVWQLETDEGFEIWHDISSEEGATWSRPARIVGPDADEASVQMAGDVPGQLHLLSVTADLLEHRWWRAGSWEAGGSLDLMHYLETGPVAIDDSATTLTTNGSLFAGYIGQLEAVSNGDELVSPYGLFATVREIDLQDGGSAETGEIATQTPPTPETPTILRTSTPTPTRAFMGESTNENGNSSLDVSSGAASSITAVLVGLIPAGVLVLLALIVVGWHLRRNRR